MPHISLRVSEQEKSWIEGYANVLGISLSDAIKNVFFEKLEDEYDLISIRDYEKEKTQGDVRFFSIEETKRELGIL